MNAMVYNPRADREAHVYRAKVTGRHAVTIPAELCRKLGIENGDSVEFSLGYGYLKLRPVHDAPVRDDSSIPTAMGMLAGYFDSMEDINRFIAQERGRWTEADEAEYQKNLHLAQDDTSGA